MTKKKNRVKEHADALYEQIISHGLDGLSEVDAELCKDMLHNYCWLSGNIAVLSDKVEKEGALITVMKGNNSYQREEQVEHPAIKVIHRLMTQKASYYSKLHKVLNIEPDEDDDDFGSLLED